MTYTPPEGVTIGSFTADTLPASFSAPADAVVTYKIYGTSEGAGEETVNLFDYTAQDPNNGFVDNKYIRTSSERVDNENWCISEYIKVIAGKTYNFLWSTTDFSANLPSIVFYSGSKVPLSTAQNIAYNNRRSFKFTVPASAQYIRASILKAQQTNAYLKQGLYKIPIALTDGARTSNYDLYIGDTKLGEDEYVDYTTQKIYKLQEGELTPTDPPATLPTITASGETTITTTETLGDVEFTGDWLAIMGSTEDESIDIDFTVDANEYIAFVTVDAGPLIQVSDTITMPSSADSFSLEVVAWGRERYTDTVYNALS